MTDTKEMIERETLIRQVGVVAASIDYAATHEETCLHRAMKALKKDVTELTRLKAENERLRGERDKASSEIQDAVNMIVHRSKFIESLLRHKIPRNINHRSRSSMAERISHADDSGSQNISLVAKGLARRLIDLGLARDNFADCKHPRVNRDNCARALICAECGAGEKEIRTALNPNGEG